MRRGTPRRETERWCGLSAVPPRATHSGGQAGYREECYVALLAYFAGVFTGDTPETHPADFSGAYRSRYGKSQAVKALCRSAQPTSFSPECLFAGWVKIDNFQMVIFSFGFPLPGIRQPQREARTV